MWIFSKRQSRAAEISNEIPTYRDPFAYNIWDPIYQTNRGIGSRMTSRFREPTRPVFGRVISREPVVAQRLPVRAKVFDDIPRIYGSETRSTLPALPTGLGPRLYMQYRFSGNRYNNGPSSTSSNNNLNVAHQGSFQKLKELIWTERAKELTQQRKAEEIAARAAALKEITAGQNLKTLYEANNERSLSDEHLRQNQDQYFHNKFDRISISNQQPGKIKAIFSTNTNPAPTPRLLLPSMIAGISDHGLTQKNYLMRPSHFRERNRVLFRQFAPSDYYQRESRSRHIQRNIGSKPKMLVGKPKTRNYYHFNTSILKKYEPSARIQWLLRGLYKKLSLLDVTLQSTGYSPESLNVGKNITIKSRPNKNGAEVQNEPHNLDTHSYKCFYDAI